MTVYAPPAPAAAPGPGRIARAERLAFIADGFSWLAALAPPLWFLARGYGLPALAYLAGAVVIGGGLGLVFGSSGAVLGLLALHLIIGFEAPAIVRYTLERSGWHQLGAVSGRSEADCERRFFEDGLDQLA